MAVTTVISAFLAVAILVPLAAQALSALGGWRTWFYVSAAGLVILAAVLWKVMLPDALARDDERDSARITGQLAGLPRLLGWPRLVGLYLTTLSVMFTFVGVTTLVQLAGPGTAGHPGVMQAVRAATLPACAIVPLAAPLLARLPGPRRLVAAMTLSVLAAAATAAAGGPITLALGLRALTVGVAATAPTLVETIGQTSPPEQRGAATALYGFALFVGASLAAPAATAGANHHYLIAALGRAAVVAVGTVSARLSTRA